MIEKKIVIKILPDGQVQAEVSGVPGKACLDYISLIEALTEAKTVDTQLTDEYFQENTQLIEKENIRIKT